ncbi:DUF4232 domain-containing protein [Streptomyces sp. NPDC051555]|uniref:DUF4232 domain-containing protein n=1 Tax=Streptomyces sp. NPDC051555 TaxID=3365657 RepID=UPI00379B7350
MTAFRRHSPRPRSTRRLAGAAAVALTAFALTACQNGAGGKEAAAPGSATVAPSTAGGTNGAQGTPTPGQQGAPGAVAASSTGAAKTSAGTGAAAGSGSGEAKGSADASGAGGRVQCAGSNTAVTVQPVTRPLNHMLITVRNTGSKPCDLTYYPVLRFDEMQWAPAARKETQPQAVVTLAPGGSGYAAAMLSAADGSGEGGTTARRLTIGFQGRTPNSSGGASATPALPPQGIYYDSSLVVTYWQQSAAEALGS